MPVIVIIPELLIISVCMCIVAKTVTVEDWELIHKQSMNHNSQTKGRLARSLCRMHFKSCTEVTAR